MFKWMLWTLSAVPLATNNWERLHHMMFLTWCFFPETKRKTNNEFGHITTLSFWSWDSSTKSVVTSPSYVQFQQGFNVLLHFLNLQTHSCHGEKRRESQGNWIHFGCKNETSSATSTRGVPTKRLRKTTIFQLPQDAIEVKFYQELNWVSFCLNTLYLKGLQRKRRGAFLSMVVSGSRKRW